MNIPDSAVDHPEFTNLSGSALKVLIYMARQYSWRTNGELRATMSELHERGLSSSSLIARAQKELIASGLIVKTRQGGMGSGPSLYAITWEPIPDGPPMVRWRV